MAQAYKIIRLTFVKLTFFDKEWVSEKGWHRSARPDVFCKKSVLRNFSKFKETTIQLYLKKRLWHRCFPINFEKFLRTPILQNTSGRLLLISKPSTIANLSCWIAINFAQQNIALLNHKKLIRCRNIRIIRNIKFKN